MSYEFRLPNVSGKTPESQIAQLQAFLRQHIQELNFVMGALESRGLTQQQRQEIREMTGTSRGKS